ncbi:MAG: hypothetical protein B6241_04080 [Spirochaetaceae bacterium 4572_59]|nr:MAG: hypothetical protein B6241_04080 [Spirochaetaceae bacterium 4572_59]
MSENISASGQFYYQNSSRSALESSLNRSGNGNQSEMAKLKESCKDFEALFVKQMLDAMKKTVNRSELVKRNMGEDIFEDMLYDEYAKKMTETSRLGIGEMMFNQLSRQLPGDIL